MVSRVHGNDGWGGDVLSVYVRVALLMCLVSSLLFQLLPSNFGLLAFFCLFYCHPRQVVWFGVTPLLPLLLLDCSMLPIAVSVFSKVASGACG
ncbi:TPA: hypothetical protein RQK03_003174 [Vibrio vulnificus]|nr:hypothetical protein [Vibrio vulnificus]